MATRMAQHCPLGRAARSQHGFGVHGAPTAGMPWRLTAGQPDSWPARRWRAHWLGGVVPVSGSGMSSRIASTRWAGHSCSAAWCCGVGCRGAPHHHRSWPSRRYRPLLDARGLAAALHGALCSRGSRLGRRYCVCYLGLAGGRGCAPGCNGCRRSHPTCPSSPWHARGRGLATAARAVTRWRMVSAGARLPQRRGHAAGGTGVLGCSALWPPSLYS